MKVEMKAKLLQYLFNKNDHGCFTKMGLLVRMFLYSCVAGVLLLPDYIRPCCCCHFLSFNCCLCSKATEARNNIGALNRAQQAYYVEKGTFAGSIEKLGVGIRTETINYSYHISASSGPVQTSNDPKESAPSFEAVILIAQPKVTNIKGYMGVVLTDTDMNTSQSITRAILCEQEQPVSSPLPSPMPPSSMPTLSNGTPQCPQGWVILGT
jgi:type IV pilus assembly protein PilA